MLNPRAIPVYVDGKEYGIVWHDYGSFNRLQVYRNDRLLGHKDFGPLVDQGQGVVEYSIRALLRGINEKSEKSHFGIVEA